MGERERRSVKRLLVDTSRLGLAMVDAASATARDSASFDSLEIMLLFSLDLEGPMRPGAIADMTRLSSGGVTKLVERLEQRGLVARRVGVIEGDRRGVLVDLTRRGRGSVRSMADAIVATAGDMRSITTGLSEDLGELSR